MNESREKLIDTAIMLFMENGFHSTGINLILEKSGVAKKTLYNHFKSKDDLIVAALEKHSGLFSTRFSQEVENLATEPSEQLVAIYDVAHAWFSESNFFGCIFVNAVGEFADRESSIRKVCMDYKSEMRDYICDLCRRAHLPDPEKTSSQLALILEGSISTAQVSGNPDAAKTAKDTALVIIEKAIAEVAPNSQGLLGRLFGEKRSAS
ncbi:TetR/AcrR family transcriptional regulator [Kordiimonas aquimaris]|uniref:TetR/AcrR family transcriptional regulator n=1 Tax=Kordiimonas aquimaris TaxID=707591 RepID=UPI0021D2CD97|nr:TetR/AcrR family transcriptional regulator [Kordiimonas aquimaris]